MEQALSFGGKLVSFGGHLLGRVAGAATLPAAASPSTLGLITGTVDWWDATLPSGALDASGAPLKQWAGSAVSAVASRIAGGSALATAGGTPATPQVGFGRRNGALGGVGGPIADTGGGISGYVVWPCMSQTSYWQRGTTLALPASQDWAIAVAWARPNLKQANYVSGFLPSNNLGTIVSFAGTNLLSTDNAYRATVAGPDTGGIYVNGTQIPGVAIAPRHHMTALLVNKAGAGMSLYLNGGTTPVATGLACPFTTAPGTLVIGGDGYNSYYSGAQIWLHEAAVFGSLSAAQIADILTSTTKLGRYMTGVGRGIRVPMVGQSNLGYFIGDGGFSTMRLLISYLTGALSVNATSDLVAPGQGLYTADGSSYLTDAGLGTDPATWAPGNVGTSEVNTINGTPSVLQADLCLSFWYYGEHMAILPSEARTTYAGAEPTWQGGIKRMLTLHRSNTPGATAANFPAAFTREMQNGSVTSEGAQVVSDGYSAVAADPAQNAIVCLQNTYDSSGRTGVTSFDGTPSHIRAEDHINNAIRASGPIARLLIASGRGPGTLPAAGIPGGVSSTGPVVTTARFCNPAGTTVSTTPTNHVLATVQHDAGNALVANAIALGGLGWTVRDGWVDATTRGTSILSSGITLLDATHILIALNSAPVSAAAACRLMYCEPIVSGGSAGGGVGTGNAVYDNAGALPPVGGLNIAGDLGAGYVTSYPLAAILAGQAFS